MTLRIATVRSAAGWEPDLVRALRVAGAARVVARCVDPGEVEDVIESIDGLVVGADAPWLGRHLLRRWAGRVAVVGVADPSDRAGRSVLAEGGCRTVVSPGDPGSRILEAVADGPGPSPATAATVTVGGARGAPGRSEVALALAWALAGDRPTLLAELDDEAPSLAIRTGLPPANDRIRADPGVTVVPRHRTFGPLSVLPSPPRAAPLGPAVHHRVVEAARATFAAVVLDAGPGAGAMGAGRPSLPLLVVGATPVGILRAAVLVADWPGTAPTLVLNRVGRDHDEALRAVRAATGLEPEAVVPVAPVGPGDPPHPAMVAALAPIVDLLVPLSGRPGSSPGSGDPTGSPAEARTPPAGRPVRADG